MKRKLLLIMLVMAMLLTACSKKGGDSEKIEDFSKKDDASKHEMEGSEYEYPYYDVVEDAVLELKRSFDDSRLNLDTERYKIEKIISVYSYKYNKESDEMNIIIGYIDDYDQRVVFQYVLDAVSESEYKIVVSDYMFTSIYYNAVNGEGIDDFVLQPNGTYYRDKEGYEYQIVSEVDIEDYKKQGYQWPLGE